MDRITQKDCEQALRVYCERAGLPYGHYTTGTEVPAPDVTYVTENGARFPAHLLHTLADGRGFYVITGGLALSGAYGGWEVQQVIGLDGSDPNRDGKPCTGVRVPFLSGHRPAREVWTYLRGAIAGLELAERSHNVDA